MPPRRRAKGLAVPSEQFGTEVNLLYRFRDEIPFSMGQADDQCTGCEAFRWRIERRVKDKNLDRASFRNCCKHGDVDLPLQHFPHDVGEPIPGFFRELLAGRDDRK